MDLGESNAAQSQFWSGFMVGELDFGQFLIFFLIRLGGGGHVSYNELIYSLVLFVPRKLGDISYVW